MNYNIITYGIYLLATVYVVVIVGNILYTNGKPFLISVFHNDEAIANAANNILLAGYYLVNIGYCIVTLTVWERITGIKQLIEILSSKTGEIILLLGLMHLFNIITLLIIEKKHKKSIINTNQKNKQS